MRPYISRMRALRSVVRIYGHDLRLYVFLNSAECDIWMTIVGPRPRSRE
jgi:hypothetical protein